MTDKEKLDAIRAEIHRIVEVRGYDREMANDLLTFMDSLPNEPVSDFEMALTEMIDKAQKCVVEPWAVAAQWKDYLIELAKSEEPVSETNKVVQVRRCLEEVATTVNPFIDKVIEQFNLKDKSIVAKEIQYRGVGLKGDFGENIHRSDDEVIYILKEDKTVGLIVIRRTEFNNAEITMVKTEERFKEKSND